MTFLTDETGADTAQPIELYQFVGSLDRYTYTSGNRPIFHNAATFRPVPIQRNEIKLGDVTERNELKVYVPITTKLVRDYGFDIPPPELRLTIFRMHGVNGDIQTWFTGDVTSITMERGRAALIIPSVFSGFMRAEFPNVYFQAQCNHPLYSTRCGVNRNSFRVEGVIDSIIDRTSIRVPEAADKPPGWFKAGELVTPDERRLIVEHNGATLTLNYPFRSLAEGDSVTMFAGCDHSRDTCNDKFNNIDNFLGFPFTPSLNPFLDATALGGKK